MKMPMHALLAAHTCVLVSVPHPRPASFKIDNQFL